MMKGLYTSVSTIGNHRSMQALVESNKRLKARAARSVNDKLQEGKEQSSVTKQSNQKQFQRHLEQAVDGYEQHIEREFCLSFDEIGKPVINVKDSKSHSLIRAIPIDNMLQISKDIQQHKGLLLNKRI